jgi:hypothetical protein
MMDKNVLCVRHVLPQNVLIAYIFPGVDQTLSRRRDAWNVVEESVTEHHVRECALIHVQPNIFLPVRVPIMHKHQILGADLYNRWSTSFRF